MTPKQARDVLRSSNLTGTSLLALLDQVVPIVQSTNAQQTPTQDCQASLTTAGWHSVSTHQEAPGSTVLMR